MDANPPKDLKPKLVKGRVKMLRLLRYKDVNVYIRQIDEDIFEYLLAIKGEIYSSYMIFTPETGKTKLTDEQRKGAEQLIFAGALTTIDNVLGVKLDERKENQVQEFLQVAEGAFGKKKPKAVRVS